MLFSKTTKLVGSIAISVFMTNVPAIVLASPGMIRTYILVEEASLRISGLSEAELQQLSGQISEARAGGDSHSRIQCSSRGVQRKSPGYRI